MLVWPNLSHTHQLDTSTLRLLRKRGELSSYKYRRSDVFGADTICSFMMCIKKKGNTKPSNKVKTTIFSGAELWTNTDTLHSHGAASLKSWQRFYETSHLVPPRRPAWDMQCLSTFAAARWGGGEAAEADRWRQADGCVDRPETECTPVQCRRYLRSDGCGIWVPDIFSA